MPRVCWGGRPPHGGGGQNDGSSLRDGGLGGGGGWGRVVALPSRWGQRRREDPKLGRRDVTSEWYCIVVQELPFRKLIKKYKRQF